MIELDILSLQHNIAFNRDQAAYKKLFIHFYSPLLSFCAGMVKAHEASEEIVSDVLLHIWNMESALANIENIRIYLFTSIRNRSLNHLTRSKKYDALDIDNIHNQSAYNLYTENPEELILNKEIREKIEFAVNELPPKCQMAYKLVREGGFSYKEVASIMGISENTVDRHLNNALHKMVHSVRVQYV